MNRRDVLRGAIAVALYGPAAFARNPRGAVAPVAPPPITFDYFIAPNGDDNNNGLTPATAWSITALNSKQSTYRTKNVGIIGDIAGTQTPIQYGTIGGTQTTLFALINANAASGPVLNVDGGTSGSPTTIAACNSSGIYTPRWAVLDFSNPSGGAHPTKDASQGLGQSGLSATQVPHPGYVTVDGIVFANFSYSGVCFEGAPASQMPGIVIQNCEFYGSNNSATGNNPGALRFEAVNPQVLNCKFHDCASSSGGFAPQYSGIMCYATTGLIVTSCTFCNIGCSIQQKDGAQDATISYCYMDYGTFGVVSGNPYGCYYEGTTGAGRTTTIHHCIMLGPMYLVGGSPGTFSGNYEFYNNTMDVVSLGSTLFYWSQPAAGGTFNAYNNVFTQQSGSWSGGTEYGTGRYTGANATIMPTWDYNYYLSSPQFCPSGTAGTVISYASWQALGFDAHSHTGSTPYASTPTAQVPSSFALNTGSAAYTGGISGAICGAIDGTGTVGCNFP